MSRIHDERKDLFSREGVLTSTANIRSIRSLSQTMEKEKTEKGGFNQHTYDSGFRAIDLIKQPPKPPQGRNIVPASLGSTQLHAMPPLMPSYISGSGHLINPVPINHSSLVRSSLSTAQHAFQTHIPVNIGATATVIAPPRGNLSMSQRTSLPSLKPTNISNQIQLPINQIPGLPTILPPTGNRTGSPIVSTHGLSSDSRLDGRATLLSEPHHTLRGNIQASSQHGGQATIQVIASGTAAQQSHVPTSFLSKGMTLSAAPNMLKIGVTAHSSTSSSTSIAASAFKLGIGKAYPGSSSVIIPVSGANLKSDIQDIRHNSIGSLAYSRYSTASSVTLPNHMIQSHSTALATTTTCLTTTTSVAMETRQQNAVGVPFHPISAAYVFHDLGHPVGIHSFSHQLIRPPSTTVGTVPMFTIESQRTLPTVPLVSVAVSNKGNLTVSESHDVTRSEGLTIHGNSSFNLSNIYSNLQPSNFTSPFSSVSNTIDSSARPSILRKRPAETATPFPVQPTEKERISSPLKIDNNSPANILQTKMISPPSLNSNEKMSDITSQTINHSILSITSDLKDGASLEQAKESCISNDASIAAQQSLLTSAMTAALNTNNNLPEASPKKKPRKQLIITTEDKYGSTAPMNSNNPTTTIPPSISAAAASLLSTTSMSLSIIPAVTTTSTMDEDEEFLKANETMKDITPPKLPQSSHSQFQPSLPKNTTINSHAKKLFSPITPCTQSVQKPAVSVKQESKEQPLVNGMILSPLPDIKPVETTKYIFHRRPQISILNEYKVNSKAAHNHFYRYSDVRVKEEKKMNPDRILTKSSLESVSGWRIQHLSTQLDDMISLEKEICEEMLKCKDTIPMSNLSSPFSLLEEESPKQSDEDIQLRSLHELLQGNIQRCRYGIDQLDETKQIMLTFLDHKTKASDLIKKYKKPRWKKKPT